MRSLLVHFENVLEKIDAVDSSCIEHFGLKRGFLNYDIARLSNRYTAC